jgi:hypothetical protein
MTALDVARQDFELHARTLERALGSGGARFNLPRAQVELIATEAALAELRAELANEATP